MPEFASAGWLEPFTGEMADKVLDDDVLEPSNLNRQTLFTARDLLLDELPDGN